MDDGTPVGLTAGQTLFHCPGTVHAPSAEFCFGFYHQPHGSRLTNPPAAPTD